jgi:hypothetical protein
MLYKDYIIKKLHDFLTCSTTFIFQWLTTEGEILGYILGSIHILFAISLLTLIFLSHTLFPETIYQVFAFLCLVLVWIQHLFLNVCIFTYTERKFSGNAPSDSILNEILGNIFGLHMDNLLGSIILCETIAVWCFSLELSAKLMPCMALNITLFLQDLPLHI